MSTDIFGRIELGTQVWLSLAEEENHEVYRRSYCLIGRPSGDSGDTFRFKADDGLVLEVNPNSLIFVSIEECHS